ncbi:MAG: hypothetical protein ACJ79L_03705 [Anaeromyxobacteraceae bacterium]
MLRSYRADLLGGDAHAVKVEDGKRTEWNEHLEVTPGRTFGGLGLVYAVKNLRERLRGGKELELRGVLMIPKPMAGPMKVRLAGREVIVVGGRRVAADKIELRPPVGPLEKVLAKLKDPPGFDVWVHADDPPMMLRTRQPLFEPKDPVVRLDTLPYAPPRSRQARVPH